MFSLGFILIPWYLFDSHLANSTIPPAPQAHLVILPRIEKLWFGTGSVGSAGTGGTWQRIDIQFVAAMTASCGGGGAVALVTASVIPRHHIPSVNKKRQPKQSSTSLRLSFPHRFFCMTWYIIPDGISSKKRKKYALRRWKDARGV